MTGSRLIVRTPSRLHFGLLGWGPGSHRQFGGLGLMVRRPGIEIVVEPARSLSVKGPRAERAESVFESIQNLLRELDSSHELRWQSESATPREHIGLGVGTQLSLAVAAAVAPPYGSRQADR